MIEYKLKFDEIEEAIKHYSCMGRLFSGFSIDGITQEILMSMIKATRHIRAYYEGKNIMEGEMACSGEVIKYYEFLLEIKHTEEHRIELIREYAKIARAYVILKNEECGLNSYLKAIKLFEEMNVTPDDIEFLRTMSIIYENTAKVAYRFDYDLALELFKRCTKNLTLWAEFIKTAESYRELIERHLMLADYFYADEKVEDSLSQYFQAINAVLILIDLDKELEVYHKLFDILFNASVISYKIGNYEWAIEAMELRRTNSYNLAKEIKDVEFFEITLDSCEKLVTIYEKIGDYEKVEELKINKREIEALIQFLCQSR